MTYFSIGFVLVVGFGVVATAVLTTLILGWLMAGVRALWQIADLLTAMQAKELPAEVAFDPDVQQSN